MVEDANHRICTRLDHHVFHMTFVTARVRERERECLREFVMKVNSSLEIHGRLKVYYKKHRDQSIVQVET